MATKTLENKKGILTLPIDALIQQVSILLDKRVNFNIYGHDSLQNAQATKQRILENIDYAKEKASRIAAYTARCFKVPREVWGIAFRRS